MMYFHHINTPLGLMLAQTSEEHLIYLQFLNTSLALDSNYVLSKDHGPAYLRLMCDLEQYFSAIDARLRSKIYLQASDFQCQVWQEMNKIELGTTCSYSDLALRLNKPKACRAVAAAVAKNPIGILQACHRVILKDQKIGDYQAGSDIKLSLLKHEEKWRARKDSNLRPPGS